MEAFGEEAAYWMSRAEQEVRLARETSIASRPCFTGTKLSALWILRMRRPGARLPIRLLHAEESARLT